MFLSYLLNLTWYYMFSRYQEVNKIVNMTVLDLSIIDKRKPIYCTTLYCEEIQEHVLSTNVPEKWLLLLQ